MYLTLSCVLKSVHIFRHFSVALLLMVLPLVQHFNISGWSGNMQACGFVILSMFCFTLCFTTPCLSLSVPPDSYSVSLLIWYYQPTTSSPHAPTCSWPWAGLCHRPWARTGFYHRRRPHTSIRSGQFLELEELLPDNMALQQQLDTLHGHLVSPLLPPLLKPRFREISSPVLQAALNQLLPWDSIHPALYSSLILGKLKDSALFCTLCKGVDHSATHCALVPLQSPSAYPSQVDLRAYPTQFDSHRRPSGPPKRSGQPHRICLSWNGGSCSSYSFPATCSYHHVCITCQAEHQVKKKLFS